MSLAISGARRLSRDNTRRPANPFNGVRVSTPLSSHFFEIQTIAAWEIQRIGVELPHKFQSKLNLPRSSRRAVELTSARDGSAASVEYHVVGCRWIEVRVVQAVEDFHAELHVELLGDAFDRIILEEGEIQIDQS